MSSGKVLLVIIVLSYFGVIGVLSIGMPLHRAWRCLGVSAEHPTFLDTRVILSGLECHRLGFDVLRENPCDIGHRPMNYPRIWQALGHLSLTQGHALWIGTALAVLFFVSLFSLCPALTWKEGFFYGVCACSPSVMLGVERGNNDLVMFVGMAGMLSLLRRMPQLKIGLPVLAIAILSVLKLYPIFGLGILMRESKATFLKLGGFLIALFGLYLFVTWEDIRLISEGTPRKTLLSYGGLVLFQQLSDGLLVWQGVRFPRSWQIVSFAILLLIIVVGVLYRINVMSRRSASLPSSAHFDMTSGEHLDAFRVGACLYLGSFCLGNNYDYRLMFLLFVLPQLFVWLRSPSRRAVTVTLIAIPMTLFASRVPVQWNVNIDEWANWVIFVQLLYLLGNSCSKWLSWSGDQGRHQVQMKAE